MRTIFLARWGSQANEALLTSYEAESREQCLENYVKPTKKGVGGGYSVVELSIHRHFVTLCAPLGK